MVALGQLFNRGESSMTELEWMDIFGDNLKSLLEESKMTQIELAEEAGIDKSVISRFIKKERIPSLKSIINIAYALDCNVSELIDFGDKIT